MNSTVGEYLCFVAAGFYRFLSTFVLPPHPPRVTLVGDRYAISAEDAKANNKNKNKKAKNNNDKANKDNMDNPKRSW